MNRSQDAGVGDGSVVEGRAVENGDGVEQPFDLDLVENGPSGRSDGRILCVMVDDAYRISESALRFGTDYGCDLLRSPGWTSTPAEAA